MGQEQGIEQQQIIISKPGIIIPKTIKQAMTNQMLGYVHLGSGKWSNLEIGRYAPYIQQWKIKKGLTLDANRQPFIFHQICQIKFEFLLELSLRQNNIQSIEAVSRIYMPNIEKLYFCNNNICSIKPIRKLYCPNLTYLSFNANFAIQTINFCYIDSQILQQFFIHLSKDTIINLNYMAKLKSKLLTKIWLGKYYQSNQIVCFKTLKKKYKHFKMDQFKTPENCNLNF